ncbi:MAG: diguanylate cyclase (GGDEF) domain-containing protein [Solidesulfovibrio magneticus str. Maddingley MBC34]|uniref:diguanylate cyclase n=1 Tax=Solidesulfovibrio magneticus str. Maddingley MBC34 TaxID=1206767 RepID=K6GUK2_9BACT|nr:MAG: diguanylate cyclase (GGDEF) domain-containing protein [Solidesulfovibrio magneticus str. Maddingley MBC34]
MNTTRSFSSILFLHVVAAWLFLLAGCATAWGKDLKNLLVLHNYSQDYPAIAAFDQGLRETLATDQHFDVRVWAEYLNFNAFENLPSYLPNTAEYLRFKYGHVKPDAVVADNAVTPLIVDSLGGLVDGVPLLAMAHGHDSNKTAIRGAMFVPWAMSETALGRNLELMGRLLPNVRRVVVVLGASKTEARLGAMVRAAAARHAGRLAVETTEGLGLEAMLDKVAGLDRTAAVLFIRYGLDAEGVSHVPARIARLVVQRTTVPVFGVDQHLLGHGMVGGYSHDPRRAGRLAGQWVLDALAGRQSGGVPPAADFLTYAFDARALARWMISESALPPGSEVLFREETLWESHKAYLLGGGLLLMAETALVIGLFVNRRRRRRAEAALAALNASLEERVTARTRELHEANEELHDAKDELEALNASLERISRTDSLTGLPNRRRAEEALHDALARFQRYGQGFVVAVADIDHFKRVNDACGHGVGDGVLREIARIMAVGVRECDLVARWGGEEFLLLLPQTDIPGASVLLERIRLAIAAAVHGCVTPSAPVTATIGAAEIRPGERLDDVIRRADEALYTGKAQGRNRVVWDAGEGAGGVVH